MYRQYENPYELERQLEDGKIFRFMRDYHGDANREDCQKKCVNILSYWIRHQRK